MGNIMADTTTTTANLGFEQKLWLTQKMQGLLYDVETHTINYLSAILV
ncbi:MAG: hypothetical protein WCO56_17640 [Verrucomicrobiota bacterium]